jgi:hypothetical protein
MHKFISPYVATKEARFFPSFFSYKVDYITFSEGDYNLIDRIVRIPFIGEYWNVTIDDSSDIEYRRKVEKLSEVVNSSFVRMVYNSKLKLNVKIIEASQQTVVADKMIATYEEFLSLPYKEIEGHFLFFTIVNQQDQFVGKSLYTIAKILNDGWEYEKPISIDEHLFSNDKNKKLYYTKDKGIKMSKKAVGKLLKG